MAEILSDIVTKLKKPPEGIYYSQIHKLLEYSPQTYRYIGYQVVVLSVSQNSTLRLINLTLYLSSILEKISSTSIRYSFFSSGQKKQSMQLTQIESRKSSGTRLIKIRAPVLKNDRIHRKKVVINLIVSEESTEDVDFMDIFQYLL